MTVIEKMINDYGIKGYKAMNKADGQIMKSKVKFNMYHYSSKLEKKIADRVERFLDNCDDYMLYNEKTGKVLIANAQYNEKMWVIGFDVWTLCEKDKTIK